MVMSISQSMPWSGATTNPGHGTKIMRGEEGWYFMMFTLLSGDIG